MKIKYSYIVLLLALVFCQSCQETYQPYDGVYLSWSSGNGLGNNPMAVVTIDEVFPKTLDINVASTEVVGSDVIVELISDPSAIDAYNKKFGTLYRALPENCYVLSHPTVTIQSGNYATTTPVKLHIISSEGMEDGVNYAVPVSIGKVSGGYQIVSSASNLYVGLNQIIVTPVIYLQQYQYAETYFSRPGEGVTLPYNVGNLMQFSCEARVNIQQWDSNPGLNTIFGLEENFVLRTTRESGKRGELEVTGGGMNNVATTEALVGGQWVHVAVTFQGNMERTGTWIIYINGEVAAQGSPARTNTDLPEGINLHSQYLQAGAVPGGAGWMHDDAPFWIGRSVDARWLYGYISEAKVWAKVLTPAEIRANMCITDPNTENLVAYWRFNEGGEDGRTFKDLTGHGFDMVLRGGSPRWEENIKCPENY